MGHNFSIKEATVHDLQLTFKQNKLTSRQLVEFYLREISRLNPILKGVIEVNPDTLYQADKADYEREAMAPGSQSRLHGIPVLLKDNIATKDKLNTTAGSFALMAEPTWKQLADLAGRLQPKRSNYNLKQPTDLRGHAQQQRKLPTKQDGTTSSARMDAIQATLDNITQRLNGSRSADHDSLVMDLPFTKRITEADLPNKFKLPHMDRYNGSQDLADNLETHRAHMALQASFDIILCRVFPLPSREPPSVASIARNPNRLGSSPS
ncbi:hypothetical protein FH972_005197 [Carpinus fangiana]|uniref:Amidase domain-containing protein n=1 Tax=Carpinus fangiana TaxID=176857 RepID=A0A5N6QQA6_9ROSI|nr:hypothetical protein FH972_005197 [Carpinus fangiana]